MKWIKAAERLPDKTGSYHCRQTDSWGTKKVVCWFTPGRGKSLLIMKKSKMEWLDESIPDNADKEEFEAIAAFRSLINKIKSMT